LLIGDYFHFKKFARQLKKLIILILKNVQFKEGLTIRRALVVVRLSLEHF